MSLDSPSVQFWRSLSAFRGNKWHRINWSVRICYFWHDSPFDNSTVYKEYKMKENTFLKICNFRGRINTHHLKTRNNYVLGIFPELERNNSSMNTGTHFLPPIAVTRHICCSCCWGVALGQKPRGLELNIGTLNVHELFWMLQCNYNTSVWPYQEWWIYLFHPKCRFGFCAKLGISLQKWKRETLSWVDPLPIYSLSSVFPCYIWCKLYKLLK